MTPDPSERYVREWLGGMVGGGTLEHGPHGATYPLPREHAASVHADPINVYHVAATTPI